MARVRQARREGVREEPALSRLLSFPPAPIRWIWAGWRCAPAPHDGRGTPGPVSGRRLGGHGEGLRRSRGEAAGGIAGHLTRRSVHGERGNHPGVPVLARPSRPGGGGLARCPPMAPGRGGGPVVVRAGESPCTWRSCAV